MANSGNEKCIFCESSQDITREHAISKNLFPDGYPKGNLATLPSCRLCNQSYSNDEELFRLFLVNQSTEKSQAARDMLYGKITRAMKRAPGKAVKVLKTMTPSRAQVLGRDTKSKVEFRISKSDWKGHHRVLDKYVKALFFLHVGKKIPLSHQIKHVFVSDILKIPNDVRSALIWNLDHESVYAYAYAVVPDILESVWTFVFYDTVVFQSFATEPGEEDRTRLDK